MSYSTRLLEQGSFLTRLSHGRRYEKTLGLVAHLRDAVALDYGCGDAWLLRRAYDRGIVKSGWGVDLETDAAEKTFEGTAGVAFLTPERVDAVPPASCDLVLCTETLEHVPDAALAIDLLCRSVKPGGYLMVTVPVEVGPSLIGKQAGRFLAGLRAPYGYETYTPRELFSAAVLWDAAGFESSHTRMDGRGKGHKGFDYRKVALMLRARLDVEREEFSPFPALGKFANSTVMWLCRGRAKG